MRLEKYKFTAIGPRSENQDAVDVIGDVRLVACVADGVGGSNCGSRASSESVREFIATVDENNISHFIPNMHEKILSIQKDSVECSGMATTFTGCIVHDGIVRGVHVGDSRCYLLRGNGIKQLTTDHTEVNRLLMAGKLTKQEALEYARKHILESAIGASAPLENQGFNFELLPKDRLLLLTDGTHGIITKRDFRDLSVKHPHARDFYDSLVELHSKRKLTDNASFVLISAE